METMHKGFDFLKSKEYQCEMPKQILESCKRNIIFLDIDGVIQPYGNQLRHDHSYDKTLEFLGSRCDRKLVDEGDPADICAAYYDWDEVSLGLLSSLCRNCGAYIVFHSAWVKSNSLERLRLFMDLYGLGGFVLDVCKPITLDELSRCREEQKRLINEKAIMIRRWLDDHNEEVLNYIVIDDLDLSAEFGRHFVPTHDHFTDTDYTAVRFALLDKSVQEIDAKTVCCGDFLAKHRLVDIKDGKAAVFTLHYSPKKPYDDFDWENRAAYFKYIAMWMTEKYAQINRSEEYDNVKYLILALPKPKGLLEKLERRHLLGGITGYKWYYRCGGSFQWYALPIWFGGDYPKNTLESEENLYRVTEELFAEAEKDACKPS